MKKDKKNKESKKKTRLKITRTGKIFFIVSFLVICVFCAYFFLFDQSVRSIFIYNNTVVSDKEIIDTAGLSNYPNFFTTTNGSIKEKLLENPYINNVTIKKRFFYEVHIYVDEYKPLFYYNETSKVVLDNKAQTENTYNLTLPVMINYVPDTKFDAFVSKFALIDKQVRDKVSEIKYDPNDVDEDRFLLYMNDSNYVYITLTKMDLFNMYNETITQLEGKKGILYLDSGNYFEIK